MTHASGIPISEDLRNAFGEARDDPNTRAIKISIVDEKMVPVLRIPKRGSDADDLSGLAEHAIARQPCYFLVKLKDETTGNDKWVFIVYAPDNSTIKDRMLYASSRETCKKSLGSGYFDEDFHVTEASEINWHEFQSHKQGKYVEAPLTSTEVELRAEKSAEVHLGHTREYVHGVKFPVSPDAFNELKKLQTGSVTAVFLSVDPTKETIELKAAHASANIHSLPSLIPTDTPTFCVFRYNHTWEGSSSSGDAFIFSCPPASPIKLKMLHASVKSPAIEGVGSAGVVIGAKLEVDDPSEINEALLNEAFHPAARSATTKAAFSKPSAAGRGGRRPATPSRR